MIFFFTEIATRPEGNATSLLILNPSPREKDFEVLFLA
jgi:hypothetical protein